MPTPRETVRLHFPWDVPTPLQINPAYHLIRTHGDYMATAGTGMDATTVTQLRDFHRRLQDENLVVEYDPNIDAHDGIDNYAGFAYRTRTGDDGDLIIRVNGFTVLTDEGELIWCFPPNQQHG